MWKFLWKRYIQLKKIPPSWRKPHAIYSISVMLIADRKSCPSLTDVKNMYGKGQLAKKGAPNGQSMFIALLLP